ncbi:hypothetical protein [Nisaea nitritireducens]|uniref:hypothetical protein n=1 Tax=Nisaea nitritireducens TaxID=568392 RepID=UPI00186835C4|nr:hypothetical protein [Nisaea nitritireducens]
MLESLELNNRDPRGRELYVRHQQVYSLLELNVQLYRMKNATDDEPELDHAIRDTSVLISELVTHFEKAAVLTRKAPVYSDNQISILLRAVSTLESLRTKEAPVASLMNAARTVVAAGSQPRFKRPYLVVSNS